MHIKLSLIISSLLLVGCATNATVSPSQNSSLNAVSPNTAAASKGGAMQNSLDLWLKEDWVPNSTAEEQASTSSLAEGTFKVSTSKETVVVTDEKPFTLQSYADKWKVYHENKEKMNEGKPKEASHIETLQNMPVIGK
jgi:oligoribonuclease NrnB/cAMP/cGMP phosphodiesterase (DHH superfamily)